MNDGFRGDAVEDHETPRAQVDNLPRELLQFFGRVGAGAIAGHVEKAVAVFEGQEVGDVHVVVLVAPRLHVGRTAIVMLPGVRLAAVVAGHFPGANGRPRLRRIVNQHRVVGDRAEMVIDVVRRAKVVVVSAVSGQLLALVNEKMAHVEVLVRGEAIAALEEEVGGVFVPRAAHVDVARPAAEVREFEVGQIALLDRGIAPEEVHRGVDADTGPGRGLVECVYDLVSGIIAVMVHQDSPGEQSLVAVAAEGPAASIAHRDRVAANGTRARCRDTSRTCWRWRGS